MSGGLKSTETAGTLPDCVDEHPRPLRERSSLGVGGTPPYLAQPRTTSELLDTLRWATRPGAPEFHVLGGMSNVVVADHPTSGVIVPRNDDVRAEVVADARGVRWVEIVAGAGADLERVVELGIDHDAVGIASLSGIPGSAGGAIVQNAGAYHFKLESFHPRATVLRRSGSQLGWLELEGDALDLGYRWSTFQAPGNTDVVWRLRLRLAHGPTITVDPRWKEGGLLERLGTMGHPVGSSISHRVHAEAVLSLRREKGMAPEFGSDRILTVGSFFKNRASRADQPEVAEEVRAWRLIKEAGLSEGQVLVESGTVRLSERHVLAIENVGGASAAEVLMAADRVRSDVGASSGLWLHPEVRLVDLTWPWVDSVIAP